MASRDTFASARDERRAPAAGRSPAAGMPYDGPQELELDFSTLWRVANNWKWLILSIIGLGLVLAVIVTFVMTPIYKSTAVLEVNPPAVEVVEDKSAAPAALNDRAYLATQFGLLASRSLAERVAQDLNLASNENFTDQDGSRSERTEAAVLKLLDNFAVEEMDESRLIRIAYEDPDPALAARIVNGYSQAFIATSLERRFQASAYARKFLENEIEKARRELEKSEQGLITYAQQNGIISARTEDEVPDSASLQRATLEDLNKQLAEVQAQRITAEQRFRESLRNPLSQDQQQGTAELRNQRALLAAEYEQKLEIFKPDYPEMLALKARIDALNSSINATSGTTRSARTNSLQEDFRATQAAENALRARVNALKAEVLDLRGSSVQYNILQRGVDTNRSLYDALLQRYKEVGVAGGVGNSQVSVVDAGDVPSVPDSPKLAINILLGLLGGIVLGSGIALALEILNDTIKTPEDVRNRLGIPFLGGIPFSKSDRPIEDLEDTSSPVSEAYFSATTSLQFASASGLPRTLLLSSTRPAEGKSTTSWAVANRFASSGLRVLLIDGDLRKPTFVTGHEKEDGFSTLLTSTDPVSAHVVSTKSAKLDILPSGPMPPNPAELLASDRLLNILAEAKSEYDLVVIDGPPVLGLADSPILAGSCDATLFVIEAGRTRSVAIAEAINRIREATDHVIGAILTRYRHASAGYGYDYDAYSYASTEDKSRQIRVVEASA